MKSLIILLSSFLAFSSVSFAREVPSQEKEGIKKELVQFLNTNFDYTVDPNVSMEDSYNIGVGGADVMFEVHRVSMAHGGRGVGVYTAGNIESLGEAVDVVVDSIRNN